MLDCFIDSHLPLKWVSFSLEKWVFYCCCCCFFPTVSACKMKVLWLGTETTHITICTDWILDSRPNACWNAVLKHLSWELVDQNTSFFTIWKGYNSETQFYYHAQFANILRGKNPKYNDYFDSRLFSFTSSQMDTVFALRMESYLYVEFPEGITFR